MKRSKRYRTLILFASMGMGATGSLLQTGRVAQAATAEERHTTMAEERHTAAAKRYTVRAGAPTQATLISAATPKGQSQQSSPSADISLNKQANSESIAAADRALTSGINAIRQGNITAAITAFEQAVSLNPSSAAAQYNLGLALRQNNQLQAAANAFWQATQADPDFALAY
ncbi:MAG: tetratricopeptide repeat protein, partial [Cyanobacteria bacterium J06576_12]